MAGAFMGLYIIIWSGLPLYITLPLAMLATGILGVLIDLLAIRPLRKDFHLAPLLSTIGVTIILQNFVKDRDKIRQGWEKLKNFNGISGVTTMDKNGDGVGGVRTLVVEGGAFMAK